MWAPHSIFPQGHSSHRTLSLTRRRPPPIHGGGLFGDRHGGRAGFIFHVLMPFFLPALAARRLWRLRRWVHPFAMRPRCVLQLLFCDLLLGLSSGLLAGLAVRRVRSPRRPRRSSGLSSVRPAYSAPCLARSGPSFSAPCLRATSWPLVVGAQSRTGESGGSYTPPSLFLCAPSPQRSGKVLFHRGTALAVRVRRSSTLLYPSEAQKGSAPGT